MTTGFLRHAALGVAGLAMVATATVTLATTAGAHDVSMPEGIILPPVIRFGAIAYAPDGAGGKAWGQGTRDRAEAAALAQCGDDTCKVLSSFTRCGAVAYNGAMFQGGTGFSRLAAEGDAVSRLGGGEVINWACN